MFFHPIPPVFARIGKVVTMSWLTSGMNHRVIYLSRRQTGETSKNAGKKKHESRRSNALSFCPAILYIRYIYIYHFWTTSTFKGPSSQSEFGSCLVTPADMRPGGTKLISKTSFLSSTWQDTLGRTVNETPDGLLSMLTSF